MKWWQEILLILGSGANEGDELWEKKTTF